MKKNAKNNKKSRSIDADKNGKLNGSKSNEDDDDDCDCDGGDDDLRLDLIKSTAQSILYSNRVVNDINECDL